MITNAGLGLARLAGALGLTGQEARLSLGRRARARAGGGPAGAAEHRVGAPAPDGAE